MGKRLILLLVAIGGFSVNATARELPIPPMDCFSPPPPPPDYRQHPPPMPPPGHHWIEPKMPLNAAQQAQLDQLLQKEHDYVDGLMKKMEESRIALRQAADREPFDEAAVTALAKTDAELQTELMLSHLRTKARIKALFSPVPK
ncbi:Heavy-metal resistance [Trichlorobacter thiogenes]|uniref:Heavy-metal resistance n=1 Tax=Trichlorobacter thiogenes TaxID=115783 RepID=A0A1T4QFV4_9BACT|nr:periplasmic heavy metal sensor [Trichlorobacter thiogenes]SKA02670.1 Heavy-metal resistance [Trichlorobacter thiogenes]